jgi:plastocyanin
VRRLVPLTALVLVLAAGCGDDDDEPGRTVTVKSGTAVQVVADEYSFDPETIVLTGGGEFEVELENTGSLAHNLRVLDGAGDIGGTPTFSGGQTRSGTVQVDPGDYELVCTVGDHEELGMTGKLTVK